MKLTALPTWEWANEEWRPVEADSGSHLVLPSILEGKRFRLRLATFNVMMDIYKGVPYLPHVVLSEERYTHIVNHTLPELHADVIGLNEVTTTLLSILEKTEWVRSAYYLSDTTKNGTTLRGGAGRKSGELDSKGGGHCFGNLLLIRKNVARCPTMFAYKLPSLSREVILCSMQCTNSTGSLQKVIVCATHLTASWKTACRSRQYNALDSLLGKDPTFENSALTVIMGDLNFCLREDELIPSSIWRDAWVEIPGSNSEKAPWATWDVRRNSMIPHLWLLGFFPRARRRLDRIMFLSDEPNAEEKGELATLLSADDEGSKRGINVTVVGGGLFADAPVYPSLHDSYIRSPRRRIGLLACRTMAAMIISLLLWGAIYKIIPAEWISIVLSGCVALVLLLCVRLEWWILLLLGSACDYLCGVNLFRDPRAILFPSDHFGVKMEIEID